MEEFVSKIFCTFDLGSINVRAQTNDNAPL